MTIQNTIGKHIQCTDSFGGSDYSLKIERTEYDPIEQEMAFYGRDLYGHPSGIYVPTEYLDKLLATGTATRHYDIDGLPAIERWRITR